MNILLLGSGGREHAIAWKLIQSPHCSKLFIAPGNAGTELCGQNLKLELSDFEGIAKACTDNNIDMVVVGPEEPLVKGITDHLRSALGEKLMIIGPSKKG